jgi:hypothetical protein
MRFADPVTGNQEASFSLLNATHLNQRRFAWNKIAKSRARFAGRNLTLRKLTTNIIKKPILKLKQQDPVNKKSRFQRDFSLALPWRA